MFEDTFMCGQITKGRKQNKEDENKIGHSGYFDMGKNPMRQELASIQSNWRHFISQAKWEAQVFLIELFKLSVSTLFSHWLPFIV